MSRAMGSTGPEHLDGMMKRILVDSFAIKPLYIELVS
jgi:hypothetical protein